MSGGLSPPVVLRAKAEQCFRAAKALPPGAEADALTQRGRQYREQASALEYGVEQR